MKKIFVIGLSSIITFCIIFFISRIKENSIDMQEIPSGLIVEIDVPSSSEAELSEYSLADITPIIAQLYHPELLTEEDVRQCGQAIIYCEMRYFGVHDAPLFMIDDNNVSHYDSQHNVIYLSRSDMKNLEDLLIAILHLSYHVYQFKQVEMYNTLPSDYADLLFLTDAHYWSWEVDNYYGCTEESREMWLEKDAEAYAVESLEDYIQRIEVYWQSEDNTKGIYSLPNIQEVHNL